MVNQEDASEVSTGAGLDDFDEVKQAACLECRKSKVRCQRAARAISCKRCANSGFQCVVPEYHVGRYKGVKNKRSGLEKAIYQVEEAVKKAKTHGGGLREEHAQVLEKLLDDTNRCADTTRGQMTSRNAEHERHQESNSRDHDSADAHDLLITADTSLIPPIVENSDEMTVHNANNPLQLLAIASTIPEQPAQAGSPLSDKRLPNGQTRTMDNVETPGFFSPLSSRLDVGPELDPVDLGLIDTEEAERMFMYFHNNLSHTRWGLDENLHGANFVRERSAFLYTAILASAALFLPDKAALSRRLNNHCNLLVDRITSGRYRSVEIIIAFMVRVPWMQPGKNWATDDQSCYYLSTAMAMALDLSMNRIVLPTSTRRPQGTMDRISQADCIEAQRALNIDGHAYTDPLSVLGRRLLRARERAWLALFCLDRGVCLARGRPWTVPIGPLVDTCDAWHVSDISGKHDGSLIASCVLRRDFGHLISSIRSTCDGHHFNIDQGTSIVKVMREKVEGFFTRFRNTWSSQLQRVEGDIPPYIEILASHGKLSAYCSVINHPTAMTDVKQFFRAAGLTAALDVLRVTVQNEQRLHSMPNNSVIMVSFAACFVLGLSTTKRAHKMYLATHVKKSIEEAANVLERIGTNPPHRRGASVLFGRHIKRILKKYEHADERKSTNHMPQRGETNVPGQAVQTATAPYTLQPIAQEERHSFPGFDSMTDDQLLAAIQSSRDDIDHFNAIFNPDDGLFMDWLDWPSIA